MPAIETEPIKKCVNSERIPPPHERIGGDIGANDDIISGSPAPHKQLKSAFPYMRSDLNAPHKGLGLKK